MFLMALVAALVVIAVHAAKGPSWAGFSGFVLYSGLLLWWIYRGEQQEKRNDELRKDAREGD